MILIDTDILVEIFEKESEVGKEAFSRIEESLQPFATTAINLHELLYGIAKYGKQTEYATALPVLDYTKPDAILSSELELRAEKKGKKVKRPDAMIAAIAINKGALLYTNNKDHFQVFEGFGLKLF